MHNSLWATAWSCSAMPRPSADVWSQHHRKAKPVTQGIYVVVDDDDAHYARAKDAGAEIVIDIKTQDYGGRDYTARDLEGHVWTFGTYDPWVS
jgi:uncharacterized glyoxalase superfamily protein PhnB